MKSIQTKRMFRFFLVFIFIVFSFVGMVFAVVNFEANPYIYDDVLEVPEAEVAVILGASILPNGQLSVAIKDRADTAVLLYQTKKTKKILVSGDNGSKEYNEVNPVRLYLLKRGINENDIFLDHAGFDTYSSMYRAKDIFLVKSIIIVTQSFHLPRSVYIAKHLGLTSYGFSADNGHNYLLKNYIREIFANVKAVLNIISNRKPKYLGEQIPITGDNGTSL